MQTFYDRNAFPELTGKVRLRALDTEGVAILTPDNIGGRVDSGRRIVRNTMTALETRFDGFITVGGGAVGETLALAASIALAVRFTTHIVLVSRTQKSTVVYRIAIWTDLHQIRDAHPPNHDEQPVLGEAIENVQVDELEHLHTRENLVAVPLDTFQDRNALTELRRRVRASIFEAEFVASFTADDVLFGMSVATSTEALDEIWVDWRLCGP